METHSPIITKSARETQSAGETFGTAVMQGICAGSLTDSQRIVCLYGDLGSGKTTFVQGHAKGIGITARLLSPTFIIVRRYNIPDILYSLYHVDLYRLETTKSLEQLGIAEMLNDPYAIICIEWADRLGSHIPQKRTDVHFSLVFDDTRELKIQSYE